MARPRQFDEDRVLSAARDQFWATGFAGTSMDAVVAATGLGKGSLYGAFGTKQALFHRVFTERCTAVLSATRQQLEGVDEQASAQLRAFFDSHAAVCAEPGLRGCLVAKGSAELGEHDPIVSEISRRTYEELGQIINAALLACQRHGDIAADADAGQLADLLLAVHRGMEALGKAGTSHSALRQIADTALNSLPRHDEVASRTPLPGRESH